MVVGFTGTRSGMSDKQNREITHYLLKKDEVEKVHHGMCIGADEDFHKICTMLSIETIVGHPGKSAKETSDDRPFRANVEVDEEYPEDTHFSRNRRIVDLSDVLLACPYNDNGQGGTWYTINYAKKIGKPYIIFKR